MPDLEGHLLEMLQCPLREMLQHCLTRCPEMQHPLGTQACHPLPRPLHLRHTHHSLALPARQHPSCQMMGLMMLGTMITL